MSEQPTSDPGKPDPFFNALAEELAKYGIEAPPIDPDTGFLMGLARSLRNREREIADIEAYAAARIRTLKNQVSSIKAWKMSEAMSCVRRLLQGKKGKSVKVPGYQFGTRLAKEKIEFDSADKDAVVEFAAKHCPDAVSYPIPMPPAATIDKAVLIAYRNETGRTPHGCRYYEAGDVGYARAVKGKDDE